MGKYKHEGKGRNISVGGGQERKDLFKDMSGGYNAMGDSNSPNYKYNGSAFKQRYSKSPAHKELVGNQNQLPDHLVKAIKAAPEMKGSPMYKSGCVSGGSSKSPYKAMGDPNKKMDRLSAKHKSLYDRFEMGQTSEAEEQRMYRLEDRMDKVGKKIKKSKKSPLNQGVKEMSKAEFKKIFEKKLKNPGDDPKLKKRLSTTQDESKKKKDKIKSKNKKVINSIKKKTSPLNQGLIADEDRTKKEKRKHKKTMKKLGRIVGKRIKKMTKKK
jgi:hypothetical protein